ncbi:MAG: hypothetical protein EHM91_06355, partial [Planctomycetota bacterium]
MRLHHLLALSLLAAAAVSCSSDARSDQPAEAPPRMMAPTEKTTPPRKVQMSQYDPLIIEHARAMISEGRETFRNDTFGSEAFWGDTLGLHTAIDGSKGPGVSPKTALTVGLKVDSEAVPEEMAQKLKKNEVDLDAPATTVALLKVNAVVGVRGFFEESGRLKSVGITCALCHSTVDDSFSPGI